MQQCSWQTPILCFYKAFKCFHDMIYEAATYQGKPQICFRTQMNFMTASSSPGCFGRGRSKFYNFRFFNWRYKGLKLGPVFYPFSYDSYRIQYPFNTSYNSTCTFSDSKPFLPRSQSVFRTVLEGIITSVFTLINDTLSFYFWQYALFHRLLYNPQELQWR